MRAGDLRGLVTATLILLIFPTDALAYLEPGAGNVLLQVLVSVVVAVGVALRVYWARLRRMLRRDRRKDSR